MVCMVVASRGRNHRIVASGLGGKVLRTSLVLLLLFGAAGCDESSSPPSANITSFEPASGTYHAGEEAASSLRFRNTGEKEQTFWIGYSVQDGAGRWHDTPADSVSLGPGEESDVQKRSWSVPEKTPLSGSYKVVMAVWDETPRRRRGTADGR